jgi:hypothetical protein
MHKTYVFRTPSNEKIEVDSNIYSFFRDIITVEDLKFLFTSKERLYTMETFELAFFNKATKEKEILNHDLKLSDLQIDEYLVIHVDIPKTTVEPEFVEEVNTVIETCVKTIVDNTFETVFERETDVADKAVDPVVETVVSTVVETVDPVIEKVETKIAAVKAEEEKVVEKKFCLIC